MDIMTMSIEEIRSRFTADGADLNVQAGAKVVRDFNDGSLFEWAGVRKHLRQDGEHVRFFWRDLASAVRDQDPDLVYLSSTGRAALELACALATGYQMEQLGYRLCSFGRENARVVLDALAIALHIRVNDAETSFR